jgi:GntR family transcriptional regulator
MHLHLDHHSGEPVYRQIVEAIKYKVASGQLADGDALPSIRDLADQLKINPGTVVRAYDELGHAGLVVMQQGKGVFITARRDAAPTAVRRKAIANLARRLLAEASRMGAGTDETLKIVRDVAREMESNL